MKNKISRHLLPFFLSFSSCVTLIRHGDPLEADVFDDEEGNGVEGAGPLEEENEFYPESSQWEAEEEEEKMPKPSTAAAAATVTEKVTDA